MTDDNKTKKLCEVSLIQDRTALGRDQSRTLTLYLCYNDRDMGGTMTLETRYPKRWRHEGQDRGLYTCEYHKQFGASVVVFGRVTVKMPAVVWGNGGEIERDIKSSVLDNLIENGFVGIDPNGVHSPGPALKGITPNT